MQRVDGYYLFQLGQLLKTFREIRPKLFDDDRDVNTRVDAAVRLRHCFMPIHQLLNNSVFDLSFAMASGEALLRELDTFIANCTETGDPDDPLEWEEYSAVSAAYEGFESVLKASLGGSGLFLLTPKNAMQTLTLVEAGEKAFPPELSEKAPEVVGDVRDAMACIAFELPTAAAFHLHRANEAVLHRYWSAVSQDRQLPERATMGQIVGLLNDNSLGREEIRSSLRDIVRLHRNPIIHPDQRLESVEQAINLYGAVRSIIGFMLEEISILSETVEQKNKDSA